MKTNTNLPNVVGRHRLYRPSTTKLHPPELLESLYKRKPPLFITPPTNAINLIFLFNDNLRRPFFATRGVF